MPYQIVTLILNYVRPKTLKPILSENSENCENIGPTFDNVDENIENSVITPAGICPLPLKHTTFLSLWGRYLNRCI